MAILPNSFDVPLRDKLLESDGILSNVWAFFFRSVYERLFALGVEQSFTLENNKSAATNIDGLKFDPRGVTCVFFEYLVQRVTDSEELTEAGLLIFVYNPVSETWSKITVSEHSPDDAGVVISLLTTNKVAQVQYTTSNQSGTPLTPALSTIWFRARTLSGKNKLYSSMGAR